MRDVDALYDIVEALAEVAAAKRASPAQVALAWLLRRPGVASLVIEARTDEQLADNLKVAELTLTPEETATREIS